MEKQYKLGIIGFGGMAHWHLTTLRNNPGERVVVKGVFDINPKQLEDAEKQGLVAYPSREALLSDKDIDLVLVATSNEVHKEIAIDAMRHGKHVITEKPTTVNSEELQELMAVSKETGMVYTIDQNRRTNHDFVLVKEAVENGTIGPVYYIQSNVDGSRGMPSGWRTIKALGGGMMLDWGVHLIDQFLYMNQTAVTSVSCRMFHIDYEDVEDNFDLVLTFEDGLTANINVGTNNYIPRPRWYVLGKKGSMRIDNWSCNGEIVTVKDKADLWEEEIVMTSAGPTKTMAPRHPDTVDVIKTEKPDNEDSLAVVYRQFVGAVEGKELTIKPEQALRVMRVMEAAFESARQNQIIKTHL